MWKRAVVVSCLIACGSSSSSQRGDLPVANTKVADAPRVEVAAVLANVDGVEPPVLVVVDAQGAIRVAAAETWDQVTLAVTDGVPARRSVLRRVLRNEIALGAPPTSIPKAFADPERTSEPEGEYGMYDDPPPPEESDYPDDGEDESGGTGTAMALDEGKMGKKDSDRAEGQYKMRKNPEAQAEYEKARAQQKITGAPGPRAIRKVSAQHVARVSSVVGEIPKDGKLKREQYALVVPASRARASVVVDVITEVEGGLAVIHDGKVRPLRVQFVGGLDVENPDPARWIEARISGNALTIEAVPGVPVEVAWEPGRALEQAAVASALTSVRTPRKLDPRAPVDILVDESIDAQRLVDLIVALDRAGVTMIGLGAAPAAGSTEANKRGRLSR